MEWVETTGRTLEEAKEAALDQLGVDERDAEFEVLAEPRRGLFGLGGSDARVRARVRPSVPRAKDDRRRRRERGRGRDRSPGADGRSGAPSAPVARRGAPAGVRDDESVSGASAGPRRRRRGGRSGAGAAGSAVATGVDPVSRERNDAATITAGRGDDDDGGDAVDGDLSVTEQADLARQFVAGLVDAFGLSGSVAVAAVEDDAIEIAVTGDDLGVLIGQKGATLQAIQELARTAVQRRTPGRVARLHVDVAGYRAKRREALERFTHQVAEQVIATGARRALEPMNPADRKIVHDTANLIDGVSTVSEGEEPRRRVVIVPAAAAAAPDATATP